MTGSSDADDLQALAGGDRDAFTTLFRRHHTFVYNVAFRRTACWAAAEDVTGVVFLELWRQRDRVEPLGGSLRPWLAGVAVNQARHVWRSRSRLEGAVGRLALVHGDDASGRVPDPADDLAARIDDERAMAALLDRLDALPTAHRAVLTLWAWEQLAYDEIAVALDVPVGTVRSRLSRARAADVPVAGAAPDPAQVARVHQVFASIAGAYTSGWRWPLRAEDVVCWFPEGPMLTSASEFPLDEAMVPQHVIDECTVGNDFARTHQGAELSPAVPSAIGEDPGLHVLLDGRACEAIGPGAHALSDADLGTVNRMRAVEVAILAAPQDYATADETIVWADAVVARNGLDLDVADAPSEEELGGPVCYIARVDWRQRIVTIEGGMH